MATTDFEDTLMDGWDKLSDVLHGMADQLYDLANIFAVSEDEIAELNAGKTEAEIEAEDSLAALVAAPIVDALNGMSDIVDNATMKIWEMTTAQTDGNG